MAEASPGPLTETIALISHADGGIHDTGWGHPEHTGRLRAVHRAVGLDQELFHSLRHLEGRHAVREELHLCHTAPYVDRVAEVAAAGGGHLDADTVVSSGSWDAATAAVGSVLDGVDLAMSGELRRSFCAVRPPGHHALSDTGMGFCIFGSVALAAHYARARHGAERVLIVDWDVHHGNGTEALVVDQEDIHFVSMHQWPWYPGTGAGTDRGKGNLWNVPMAAGLPRHQYVDALLSAIDAATRSFTPDLLLVSSGFDSMAGDPLGGFTLQAADFVRLTTELCDRADQWCGGRLVSVLEGGYNTTTLGGVAVAHMRALSGMSVEGV